MNGALAKEGDVIGYPCVITGALLPEYCAATIAVGEAARPAAVVTGSASPQAGR
jgi:hypothetical protein